MQRAVVLLKILTKSIALLTKAAEQGDAKAQYQLGIIYSNSQGVIQDPKQAALWYQKAAEQGYNKAQDQHLKSF